MACELPLQVPGGLYPIVSRGNVRQEVFFIPTDRYYLLLDEGVNRFGYRIPALRLMTNYLHLTLRPIHISLPASRDTFSTGDIRYSITVRLPRLTSADTIMPAVTGNFLPSRSR